MWEDAAFRLFGRLDTADRTEDAARWMAIAGGLAGVYLITAGAAVSGGLWLMLAIGFWVWTKPIVAWAMLGMACLQLAFSIWAAAKGIVDYIGIGMSLVFIVFASRAVQVARAWRMLDQAS